jgi:hypothetical protein
VPAVRPEGAVRTTCVVGGLAPTARAVDGFANCCALARLRSFARVRTTFTLPSCLGEGPRIRGCPSGRVFSATTLRNSRE